MLRRATSTPNDPNAKRRRHTRSRSIPRRSRIDDSQGPRPMKSTRRTLRALGGAVSLILVGCWTPAPYGYTTNPGYYGPPPNQGFVGPPGGNNRNAGSNVSGTAATARRRRAQCLRPGGNWAPAPAQGPTPAPTQVMPPPNSGSLAPMPGAPTQTFDNDPSRFSPPQVGSSRRPEVPVPPPS